MKELVSKYKGVLSYLFFGVCTTVVNIAVYYLCAHIFGLSTAVSTVVAWLFAVTFAYITNKIWVFESKSWERSLLIKEIISFFSCRLATGVLDLGIMMLFVDVLHMNDLVIKIISNILVVIINYIASKLVIFRQR